MNMQIEMNTGLTSHFYTGSQKGKNRKARRYSCHRLTKYQALKTYSLLN